MKPKESTLRRAQLSAEAVLQSIPYIRYFLDETILLYNLPGIHLFRKQAYDILDACEEYSKFISIIEQQSETISFHSTKRFRLIIDNTEDNTDNSTLEKDK